MSLFQRTQTDTQEGEVVKKKRAIRADTFPVFIHGSKAASELYVIMRYRCNYNGKSALKDLKWLESLQ